MANPNARDVKAVAKALAEPVVAGALVALEELGCDREELLRLLGRLRHADIARRRATKHLKTLSRTLEQAATGIVALPEWPESRNLGLPDDAETWLVNFSHDLKLLADAIRTRLAQVEPAATDPRIDRARASLGQYVIDSTGQRNDTNLTVLIDAVLG